MKGPHQKRSLSQVFLKTKVPCEQLASLLQNHDVQQVLEIGPGKGVLTKVLIDRGMTVTCVEKDRRFVDYLSQHFEQEIQSGKLTIHNADILKFDLEAWIRSQNGAPSSISGNIPYNISSPLLEHLLPNLSQLKVSALLVQLEFAQRLVSPPGSKTYGSLSVFVQLRSNPKIAHHVNRNCFSPVPKVDSAIVTLEPLSTLADESLLKKVEQVTKTAFSQRRKKISNALSVFLSDLDKAKIPFDLSQRPETFSPQDYLKLTALLFEGEKSFR